MPDTRDITELQHKAFAAAYCDERYCAFPALATSMPGLKKPALVLVAVNRGELRVYGLNLKGEIGRRKLTFPLSDVTDFSINYRFPYVGGLMRFSLHTETYDFCKFGKIRRELAIIRTELAG